MKNIKMASKFQEFIKKYDFAVGEGNNIDKGKYISLKANTTNGYKIEWLKYYPISDKIILVGNTDQCNIWLYHTRKDFTPEKINQFVTDLNNIFRLTDDKFTIKELIDPEDWQEIADINDAYTDFRYTL